VPARASEAIDLHDDPKPHEGNASHALPVTTTPPSTKPPAAILRSVAEEIKEELKDSKYQGVAALLAFCFGTVLVFNGDFSFKGIIACCVFVVVGITAMNEVNDWGHVARSVVGLEAGFVGAFAAYRGMDGMEVTVGAFLGVLAALRLLQFLNTFGVHFITDHRWMMLSFYTVFVAAGVLLFFRKKHLKLLALISAAIGGAFCTSALAFAVTDLAKKGYLAFLTNALPALQPQGGTWVDFFDMLWSPEAPALGLFAGSKYNPVVEGRVYSIDRMADVGLWLIFFVVGSAVQLRRLRPAAVEDESRKPLLGELPR